MERDERNDKAEERMAGVNPGYVAFQLAKALTRSQEHADPATKARAQAKIEKWAAVPRNVVTGSADYGSRTPVGGEPAWATLEVVTGGFATGELLAAGALQAHELDLLRCLPKANAGEERRILNGHFLAEDGLADLHRRSGSCTPPSIGHSAAVALFFCSTSKNRCRSRNFHGS